MIPCKKILWVKEIGGKIGKFAFNIKLFFMHPCLVLRPSRCQSDIAWGVNSITDDLKSAKGDFKRKTTNEGWENDPFELEDNL